MKALAKAAVTLGAVAALAGLLVLTKPGSRAKLPPATPSHPDRADGPSTTSATRRSLPTYRQPTAVTSGASAAPSGSGDVQAYREHGRSAVLRTPDGTEAVKLAADRPLGTPRWDSPVELKFVDLKERYRGYRKLGDFSPEVVSSLHGAAAIVAGAVMPIDPVANSGDMKRFWLANPVIVMAGCVFCNPPTMGDLVYVTATERPVEIDPERLFRGVVMLRALGRLELGPRKSADGVEYLYGLELREQID